MIFDTHMHTKFSTDSKMNIEDAINKAKDEKIGIIITEHMDINFPVEGKFIFECEKYFDEYNKYRNDKVLLGIELGLRMDCIDENIKIIDNNNFDFVLGSIHVVDKIDIFFKEYYEQFTNKKGAYEKYLESMYECVKTYNCFDSMAHIDYICRYSPYEDREIYYRKFADYIDEVLKVIIEKDKVIEINTARLNQDAAIENLTDIYRRYKELGGKYVTVGSDSHNSEDIARNFNEAYGIIEKAGLKSIYFRDRKMII